MKCEKCGGRTVLDDVHTYMGHETERRCLMCGRRYPIEPDNPASDSSDKTDKSDDNEQKKEEEQMGARGTCANCNRPGMAIQARGLCGKCFYQAKKAGTVEVKPRGPAVPPPCSRRATVGAASCRA